MKLSKRGSVLAPVEMKTNLNRTGVHLLAKMDTRFDVSNDLERLGSPEVSTKRQRAKTSINVIEGVKQKVEREALMKLKRDADAESALS